MQQLFDKVSTHDFSKPLPLEIEEAALECPELMASIKRHRHAFVANGGTGTPSDAEAVETTVSDVAEETVE